MDRPERIPLGCRTSQSQRTESPDTSDPPAERKHDDRPGGGLVGSLIVGIVDMGASLVAPYEIASGTAIAWRMKHGHVTASPPVCTENSNPDVVMVKPAEDGL